MSFFSATRPMIMGLTLAFAASAPATAGPRINLDMNGAAFQQNGLADLVQVQAGGAGLPLTTSQIHSGHSLTDPIPDPLREMVNSTGLRGAKIDRSTIPGSPMEIRWTDAPGYGAPDARHDIGNYELLVITERVSLSNTLPWHNSLNETLQWMTHAWVNGNGGNGAATVLYASWVTIETGPGAANPHNDPDAVYPFRERLDREMAQWEQMMNYANANRIEGAPPMRMVPGPLVMAAVYDGIEAGQAPGLSDISDLFSDDIHVNDYGAYLMTLAHYAVIYGLDPRGLTNRVGLQNPPSPELAAWMQSLVWDVVTSYPGTGITATN